MSEEKQTSMENDLFHEEREELRLLDCFGKLSNVMLHLKSKTEASAGNYDYAGKHHRMLGQTVTSLSFVLYWTSMIQSLTTKLLAKSSNFEAKDLEFFYGRAHTKAYQLDLIDTPHGLYESYLRAYRELEMCVRANQHTIDRLPKGNDLIVYTLDSMQDAGRFLEEIL